jgi:3-hydroxyacyl-[acyl-carrier-protein] dehydratase
MERLNGLFEILEASLAESQYTARIVLNPEHEVYKGHFPGYPVTPGVVQMHIVDALLSKALGCALMLQSMPSCKFLKVLNPALYPELNIQIRWQEKDGIVFAEATGQFEGFVFFKMNPLFVCDPESAGGRL